MPPDDPDTERVTADREMWLGVRRGLKQMLAAIEKRYGLEARERDHQ